MLFSYLCPVHVSGRQISSHCFKPARSDGRRGFFVVLLLFFSFSFFFALQMGGASSYNTQFMPHPGPRGPPGMASSGMVGSRPPSMGGMYSSQGQRMPQHSGYPGGQQGPPPRHQQGLKRPYNSEVSERRYYFCVGSHLAVVCNLVWPQSLELSESFERNKIL